MADKCKTCKGEGWIAQIVGTNRIQIMKCDTCNAFPCDYAAVGYVVVELAEARNKAEAYPGLVEKSQLFDELVVAYRKKFAINDNAVSLMVLVDEFATLALKAEGEK
jgi:hypothetical protein